MKMIFAALAAFLLSVGQVNASGFGGGSVSGFPQYDWAWFNFDAVDEFGNIVGAPYAYMQSGTLVMQNGSASWPTPGIL